MVNLAVLQQQHFITSGMRGLVHPGEDAHLGMLNSVADANNRH